MRPTGFTLIEILVGMVIVAILATTITIAIGTSGGARQLQREAERFQALITYACEQAELSGQSIGISLTGEGYRFSQLERETWQPLTESILRKRTWLRGIQPKLSNDNGIIELTESFSEKPQLVCFSSGELTPFQLNLLLADSDVHYRLQGDIDGMVSLKNEEIRH